jgi:hypothetical protein
MSSNLKSPPKGLKNSKCKKGKLIAQPPIPYFPPVDQHKKREPEQIKVKLPDETYFQMAAFENGNNKEYLVHVIAILHVIEQKGTERDVKKAFEVLVAVRREMKPLFEFPDNKTEAKKEEQKKKLLKYNDILKAKKDIVVAEAQKAYKLFCCFVAGEMQMYWDRIVHKMNSKDSWIGVNGKSNQGLCVRSSYSTKI